REYGDTEFRKVDGRSRAELGVTHHGSRQRSRYTDLFDEIVGTPILIEHTIGGVEVFQRDFAFTGRVLNAKLRAQCQQHRGAIVACSGYATATAFDDVAD